MKRALLFVFCILMLISALSLSTLAHSGGTDASGGHVDNSTGEYHYHHGYPAHQHTGGKCPYNYNDKTGDSASSTSLDAGEIAGIIIACIVFAPFILFCIFIPLGEKIKDFFSSTLKDPSPQISPPQEAQHKPADEISTQPQAPPAADQQPSFDQAQSPPASPPPQLRGSEHKFPHTSKNKPPQTQHTPLSTYTPQPKGLTPRKPVVTPRPPSAPRPLPFANGIIAEHPAVLNADPAYLTEAQVLAYALSIETPRGKKAITEQFLIKNKKTDTSVTPHRVSASVISLNSVQEYNTTLLHCSCPDHRARHLPCKHMIALAISVNAITINTEVLQEKE